MVCSLAGDMLRFNFCCQHFYSSIVRSENALDILNDPGMLEVPTLTHLCL
jgi:hypothetical protein